MGKKDAILLEIEHMKFDGTRKITISELHNLIRRHDIVEQWKRKDIVMWLAAKGKIKLEGPVVELVE